jgi:hypothetical protein
VIVKSVCSWWQKIVSSNFPKFGRPTKREKLQNGDVLCWEVRNMTNLVETDLWGEFICFWKFISQFSFFLWDGGEAQFFQRIKKWILGEQENKISTPEFEEAIRQWQERTLASRNYFGNWSSSLQKISEINVMWHIFKKFYFKTEFSFYKKVLIRTVIA